MTTTLLTHNRLPNQANRHLKHIWLSPLVLYLFLALPSMSYASPMEGIELSPSVVKIRTTPLQLIQERFTIKNNSYSYRKVSLNIKEFSADSSGNGLIIYSGLAPEEPIRSIVLTSEGKTVKELELAPQEKRPIVLNLPLSNTLLTKDYYFSLLVIDSSIPQELPSMISGITLRPGVGSHMLVSVMDPENKSDQSKDELAINKLSLSPYQFGESINISLSITNKGKYYQEIKPTITVTDMFGREIAKKAYTSRIILSKSTRYIPSEEANNLSQSGSPVTFSVNNSWLFGLYKVTANVSNSSNETVLQKSGYFLAMPIPTVILIVIAIFLLTYILKRVRKYF